MRTHGRAALVVKRVLAETLLELCRVGFAAMRVEDIAQHSKVHKTTIYRRWPTKSELVAAALADQCKQRPVIDTGSLRADLRASLLQASDLQPSEQAVLRVIQAERMLPDFATVVDGMRTALYEERLSIVQRGVARGELPATVDADLLIDLVSAPVQRALLFNEQVDPAYVERLLDVVLAGVAAVTTDAATPSTRDQRRHADKPRNENKRGPSGAKRARS